MQKNQNQIASIITDLISYAQRELYLEQVDAFYAKNRLMARLGITEPAEGSGKELPLQSGLLDAIVEYAVAQGICREEDKLLFETEIMGLVTPAPSAVVARFDAVAATCGAEKATSYLNEIGIKSNYIRQVDIKKNIYWTAPGHLGDLTISVNLAKPEKDNKQIALERSAPDTAYPKCALCVENLGFQGNVKRAARETLRIIPITLNGEQWALQMSPYVYFDNHCIALSYEHRPMCVDGSTFTRLFDFVELFPHYFIGSNSDLPIVGGSILNHEHYQGGKKVLPMFKRHARRVYAAYGYPNVTVSVLDWYNSVIKLTSQDREAAESLATRILGTWRGYSDPAAAIIAKTDAPHNTATCIACLSERNGYELYIILRNNRTDSSHPYGIFHPTEDMHNIKKEGIGLIEAMGLFILPGRLEKEIWDIADILTGSAPLDFKALSDPENPLSKHLHVIAQLTNDFGTEMPQGAAQEAVIDYVNATCVKILECTGVFKNTDEGQNAFSRFLSECGLEEDTDCTN